MPAGVPVVTIAPVAPQWPDGVGAARAVSLGRSRRASCPSLNRCWPRFAPLAALGQQRRLDGTGIPAASPHGSEEGSGLPSPSRRRRRARAGTKPERGRLRAREAQDERSARPARGCGQTRAGWAHRPAADEMPPSARGSRVSRLNRAGGCGCCERRPGCRDPAGRCGPSSPCRTGASSRTCSSRRGHPSRHCPSRSRSTSRR